MKSIKKLSLWRMMVLFMVALTASMAISSCSKDDDDDNPGSSSSIVGTWYFVDDDGELDYEDCFVFKSNGAFTWYDDMGTYKFNEKTNTLVLYWEEYDEEDRLYVEFLGKNMIEIEDFGIYKKK